MNQADVYQSLAEKFDYRPSTTLLQRILKRMLTPEDAKLMLALPASLDELAEDSGQAPQTLEKRLQGLVAGGLVVRRRRSYALPQNVPHLHDGAMTRPDVESDVSALWREFREVESQVWVDWLTQREEMQFRVIPAWKALETVPSSQVLPCEDVKGIAHRAESIYLINCPCRAAMRRCDAPVETCLQFGRSGDYLIKTRSIGRQIPVAEALALIDQSMERGLVHIALNTASDPPSLCSCCADCCAIIEPLTRHSMLDRGLAKSRYRAVISQDLCNGCQTCVERCQFDAIEMKKSPPSKRLKATVHEEKCYGCGQCVIKCEPGAISLEVAQLPEYILKPGKASLY